jgi:HSP20 family protein
MTKGKRTKKGEEAGGGIEGIFRGLSDLVERLSDLAEKGEQLSKSGEFQWEGGKKEGKGIFGFSVKVGLGGEEVEVRPFGNIGKDKATGKSVVREIREPLVDVFEEEDHVLIVAEMPGIEAEDVQLDLVDDVLTLSAQRGNKKYRKEILLPGTFRKDQISVSCKHGIVEIKCGKH